jgi:hypothetical protein
MADINVLKARLAADDELTADEAHALLGSGRLFKAHELTKLYAIARRSQRTGAGVSTRVFDPETHTTLRANRGEALVWRDGKPTTDRW